MKIAILGRQPEISLAELTSLYPESVQPFGTQAALINKDIDITHLGGTVKLASPTSQLDTADWAQIRKHLAGMPKPSIDGKFKLGLSAYGFKLSPKELLATGLTIKKAWAGVSVRIIPNADAVISAAQVLHNGLLADNGSDLVIVTNGSRTIIGRTEQVQDIDAYSARDQARPSRSAKVGMLPPKLAQILINLANPPATTLVVDPFCGSGVILQEALLMGHPVFGSDLNTEMVQAAQSNLQWLGQNRPLPDATVTMADARQLDLPDETGAVVSEGYLGPALSQIPTKDELARIKAEISSLTTDFLSHFASQLKPTTPIVFCLPAWRIDDRFYRVNILDQIKDLGYTSTQFAPANHPLIYWRPGQLVGREIIVLRRL